MYSDRATIVGFLLVLFTTTRSGLRTAAGVCKRIENQIVQSDELAYRFQLVSVGSGNLPASSEFQSLLATVKGG